MKERRKKIIIRGIVQGVGFRPFVYRLATEEGLHGFVTNTSGGVEIEAEGEEANLSAFLRRLSSEAPPLAEITEIHSTEIPSQGEREFVIHRSRENTERSTLISPDMSVCPDCLEELLTPEDRRYLYPFINCTNCGPRFTIIKDIPYDRPLTTMSSFTMCPECRSEYENPADRRFHAQPNACPVCGPKVILTDAKGKEITCTDPLSEAAKFLSAGKIVAVKGLGGFHLACDAACDETVSRLRLRKRREEKPLAVMARDLNTASGFANIGPMDEDLLLTSRRPIVLVSKKHPFPLAASIAPGNKYVGVMLPYTPLHVILLRQGPPVLVMTSGNLSEEPIAYGNEEALRRLGDVADYFILHDRNIHQRADDSVFMVAAGMPRPLRRSRGYIPVPVFLAKSGPSVLAVSGEMKNCFCLTREDQAFLSQHIGDLENLETLEFMESSIQHFERILSVTPGVIAHDMHPDYLSTKWARKQDLPCVGIQHHHAHIASCLAENGREDTVIGLALDGTGYGDDGTIWGGEILIADTSEYRRGGHFALRAMPGGTAAIKNPWRMALSYLWSAHRSADEKGDSQTTFFKRYPLNKLFPDIPEEEIRLVHSMVREDINCVQTSSLGRLFDGVAAIAGLRSRVSFEGQAAMELENVMDEEEIGDEYAFPFTEQEGRLIISPDFSIRQAAADRLHGRSAAEISRRFHDGLITLFTDICQHVRRNTGLKEVALSGGCFQNRYLLERLNCSLAEKDFTVITHSLVPANDGGLALGQAIVAQRKWVD